MQYNWIEIDSYFDIPRSLLESITKIDQNLRLNDEGREENRKYIISVLLV